MQWNVVGFECGCLKAWVNRDDAMILTRDFAPVALLNRDLWGR